MPVIVATTIAKHMMRFMMTGFLPASQFMVTVITVS